MRHNCCYDDGLTAPWRSSVAKYWRDWRHHRWIVCVFNNEDLNQVT